MIPFLAVLLSLTLTIWLVMEFLVATPAAARGIRRRIIFTSRSILFKSDMLLELLFAQISSLFVIPGAKYAATTFILACSGVVVY